MKQTPLLNQLGELLAKDKGYTGWTITITYDDKGKCVTTIEQLLDQIPAPYMLIKLTEGEEAKCQEFR